MSLCDEGTPVVVSARDGNDIVLGGGGLGHTTVDLTRSKCYGTAPVIQCYQGQPSDLKLYCMDRNGAPVDISQAGLTARFVCKEHVILNRRSFDVEATIEAGTDGIVACSLTSANLAGAGLFVTQLIIKNADDQNVWTTPYWLAVSPSLEGYGQGPITFAEVRMVLRDTCPEQNLLLQDFEFDDSQIAAAMAMPVNEFNEKHQPKTRYTPKSFPYHYHWLRATAGYLLEMAARGYARDHLDYMAAGVNVQDKNKASAYFSMAKDLLQEWRDFVKATKLEINIQGGFGTLRSAYGYRGSRW